MDQLTDTPPDVTTRQRFDLSRLKDTLEGLNYLVTVLAILVGGFWTYRLFVVERQDHAQATLHEDVSHVSLSNGINLLRVVLRVENTGHKLMSVSNATARVQRILPIAGCEENGPCVAREINAALSDVNRTSDYFNWPVISERVGNWVPVQKIEPGESAALEFQFALPATVETVRVYGFVPNDEQVTGKPDDLGWSAAQIYSFNGKPRTGDPE